ncbi:MAG: NADH-quinone oxidoreductase subunit N [Gemmataceae bacterium]
MFNKNALESMETLLFRDLSAFLPELLLCAGIVSMLLLRLLPRSRGHMGSVALIVTALGFVAAFLTAGADDGWFSGVPMMKEFGMPLLQSRENVFGRMLVIDHLTNYVRLVLFGFGVLVTWLTVLTGIPDAEDSADFYTLLLGGLLGMSLMASTNHLLMVFIAVEMASLPSYALAGFLKGRRQSSEAALKYVVYGGGASGVMLYGISLIAGRFGTGHLPQVAEAVRAQLAAGGLFSAENVSLILGFVFLLIGLAFKLSAVPFHFWCPDVFEGASAEIGAFLSVASKAAAMALTGRLLLMLTVGDGATLTAVPKAFAPTIAFFAALTATFGNLAAYSQTNLKRLLAYSTIAHAGYMMMGLAPMTRDGLSAVLFYLASYVFMNLGAFAIIALLRNQTGSEDLGSFRGLIYRSPLLVCLLAVFLLSLLGLPPLVGFAAKFQVFSALFHAGQDYAGSSPTLSYTMYALLVIGGVNTVFSVFYYLKVLKVMILDKPVEELEGQPAAPIRLSPAAVVYTMLLGLMIFVGGLAWNPLAAASDQGTRDFKPVTGGAPVVNTPAPGAAGAGGPAPKGGAPKGGAPKGGGKGGKQKG